LKRKTTLITTLLILTLTLTTITLVTATDPDTVAVWHFDEGTGITAADDTGNGHDGTLINSPSWVTGKIGGALQFDGTNYVSIPDDTALDISEGTWEAWIKFDQKPSDAGHLMNPVAKQEQYWIHASSDDSIQAKISVGSTRYIATTGADYILTGVWYHVACTYDQATLKLYIDGELVAENTAPSGPIDASDPILAVGTWSTPTDYFKGVIDEVRIWDRALTADEVKTHQCLVGEWDFNEDSTTDAYDSSGFENHGTIYGATQDSGFCGSLLFDGISDYIEVPDDPSLDFGPNDDMTIEAWIKTTSSNEIVISKRGDSSHTDAWTDLYVLWMNPAGKAVFYLRESLSPNIAVYAYSTTSINDGDWHHIMGVRDTTAGVARIYVDGFLEAEESDPTADLSNNDPLWIGKQTVLTTAGHWEGNIDEVRIWRCAKTPPVADANGPYEDYVGVSITLDASGSYDPDGTIVSYDWDLDNDGEFDDASGETVLWSWSSAGTYTISLRVRDEFGLKDTDTEIVTIHDYGDLNGHVKELDNDPVSGATMNLYDSGSNLIATTTTDGAGYYEFLDLEAGDYTVELISPAGYTPATDSALVTIVYGITTTQDFSLFKHITVSGFKYLDYNGEFPMDTPLDGWTIHLYKYNDIALEYQSVSSVVTGNGMWPDGYYEIKITTPGDYQVRELLEIGWTETSPAHYYGDGSIVPGETIPVTSGTDVTGQDFWNFPWITVTGTKYYDSDGIGPKHPDEPGLSNWVIWLDDTESDTTDENGEYMFVIKDPGVYTISEELMEGCWEQTYPESDTYTVDTAETGWDVTGDWVIRVYYGGTYDHDFSLTLDVNGKDFTGTGGWPAGGPYGITEVITGELLGSSITWHSEYSGSTYEWDAEGTIAPDGTMSGTWTSNTGQAGTWESIQGKAALSTEITDLDFGNWLGKSWISSSSFCCFDMDEEEDGRQFRLIFTPDVNGDPNLFKISATNPGQFYYHVFYTGPLTTSDAFSIELGEHFVTKGANPVHIYSSLNTDEYGCLVPGEDITDDFTIVLGDTITVTPNAGMTGFFYINVHCDYGLKHTTGYEPQPYDTTDLSKANAVSDTEIIDDLTPYEFSVDGPVLNSQFIENRNVFKKIRGIAGYVTDFVSGVTITITGPDGWSAVVITDDDGFFGYSFHHKGKQAKYTVTATDYQTVEIWLKAGRFGEAIMVPDL
jgi:hypothetical protein